MAQHAHPDRSQEQPGHQEGEPDPECRLGLIRDQVGPRNEDDHGTEDAGHDAKYCAQGEGATSERGPVVKCTRREQGEGHTDDQPDLELLHTSMVASRRTAREVPETDRPIYPETVPDGNEKW